MGQLYDTANHANYGGGEQYYGNAVSSSQHTAPVRKGNLKGKKQQKYKHKAKQSPIYKHEKTLLGDFIELNLDGSSSSSVATAASKRTRKPSSSLCIYGLTCANKECIYTHQ